MFVWILIFAILGAGAALLIRSLRAERGTSGRPGAQGESSALRILQERYARGEIDQEEFEERRQTLLR